MSERINDGEVEGEYTDSEIPGDASPEETARTGRPGEYTDSEIPGETKSDKPGESHDHHH